MEVGGGEHRQPARGGQGGLHPRADEKGDRRLVPALELGGGEGRVLGKALRDRGLKAGDVEIGGNVRRDRQARDARRPLAGEVDDHGDLEGEGIHVLDQAPGEHVALGDGVAGGEGRALVEEVRGGGQGAGVEVDEGVEGGGHGGWPQVVALFSSTTESGRQKR